MSDSKKAEQKANAFETQQVKLHSSQKAKASSYHQQLSVRLHEALAPTEGVPLSDPNHTRPPSGDRICPNSPPQTTAPITVSSTSLNQHQQPLHTHTRPQNERYERLMPLGRGGMSEVELCLDHRLGRPVARKQLLTELQSSDDYRRRFLREIQLQAQLEHPSIVPVFDSCLDTDGQESFTMRRISGTTLTDAIKKLAGVENPIDQRRERNRLLRAFLQACLAIDYAHHLGVVHRDIKPGNMMLGRFGELYVLDWGVAKILDEEEHPAKPPRLDQEPKLANLEIQPYARAQTRGYILLGTPAYMAPEQFYDSSSATVQSDIYSLGAVLFQILSLELLNPNIELHLSSEQMWPSGEALEPSRRNPKHEIPEEFDSICRRACSPDASLRYATARELHDAVEAVLQGDRDLELRNRLATNHLERAVERLQESTEPNQEALVLQEVGRALTLNPHNQEAAELLGTLMLSPMETMPESLQVELTQADQVDAKRALRANSWTTFGSLLIVCFTLPFLHVQRWDLLLGSMLPAALAGLILATVTGSLHTPKSVLLTVLAALGLSTPIALSATAFGPLVLPPLLACVICTTTASIVALGWKRMAVIGTAFTTLIFTLVLYSQQGSMLGFQTTNNTILFRAEMLRFQNNHLFLAFTLFAAALILSSIVVVWRLMDALSESRRQVHQYEWKLRQATSLPPRSEE